MCEAMRISAAEVTADEVLPTRRTAVRGTSAEQHALAGLTVQPRNGGAAALHARTISTTHHGEQLDPSSGCEAGSCGCSAG